jgi:hypothetical protein
MITINTEKGLVKVESWEDVESLPGFVKNLNPTNQKLDAIIGRYIFKEKINCGLSNCHTPHAKGFIVKTIDGASTNIGKDCGKTYFGVDFETLSNKFDRDITESENRDKLWSFSFKIDEIQDAIHNLRCSEYGANWIYKKSRYLVTLGADCPNEIVKQILSMGKNRSSGLFKPREATDFEIEALSNSQNRQISKPHFIEEKIADISGLDALYPENDLKNILVIDLEENFKTFISKDIDQLSFEDLKYWSKWIGTVETSLQKANDSIQAGRNLLTQSNLKPFLTLLTKNEDKLIFRRFLEGLTNQT